MSIYIYKKKITIDFCFVVIEQNKIEHVYEDKRNRIDTCLCRVVMLITLSLSVQNKIMTIWNFICGKTMVIFFSYLRVNE